MIPRDTLTQSKGARAMQGKGRGLGSRAKGADQIQGKGGLLPRLSLLSL